MAQEANIPANLWEQIDQRIQQRVQEGVASILRSATITSGGTTIQGGRLRVLFPDGQGGDVAVYFGDIYSETDSSYIGTGILVQNSDGKDIAQFRSDAVSGGTRGALFDSHGQGVVGSDIAPGGFGLARPVLAHRLMPARFADWPFTSTSSTFETLIVDYGYRQHAGMYAYARCSASAADTTVEVRVLVNGNQLGNVASVGFAQTTVFFGPAIPPGAHEDWTTVEIQGRVASGTGSLRMAGGSWLGFPTA